MRTGRPRVHDRSRIAKEIIEWSELPDSLTLNRFCTSRIPPLDPLFLRRIIDDDGDDELSLACRVAKANLAANREEANTDKMLSNQAFSSNLRTYDKFNEDQWQKELKFVKQLDKDSSAADTAAFNDKFDQIIAQFTPESSTLNIDDNNTSSEQKS